MKSKLPVYVLLSAILLLLFVTSSTKPVAATDNVWVSAENLPSNRSLQTHSSSGVASADNAYRAFALAFADGENYVLRYRHTGELEGGYAIGTEIGIQFSYASGRNWIMVDKYDGHFEVYDWNGTRLHRIAVPPYVRAAAPPLYNEWTDEIYLFRDTGFLTLDAATLEVKATYSLANDACQEDTSSRFTQAYIGLNPNFLYLTYPLGDCELWNPPQAMVVHNLQDSTTSSPLPLGHDFRFVSWNQLTYLRHTGDSGQVIYVQLEDGKIRQTLSVAQSALTQTNGFGFASRWNALVELAADGKSALLTSTLFNEPPKQVALDQAVILSVPYQVMVLPSADRLLVIQQSGVTSIPIESFIHSGDTLPGGGSGDCIIPSSGPWPPCATDGVVTPPSGNDCVIPPSGPWPTCATGGGATPSNPPSDDCVIPPSGPWPTCATGGGATPSNPPGDDCVIPPSGPWPACARTITMR